MGYFIALFVIGYVMVAAMNATTTTYAGTPNEPEPQQPTAPIRWRLVGVGVAVGCLMIIAETSRGWR